MKTLIGLAPVATPSTVNPYAMRPVEIRELYRELGIFSEAADLRAKWHNTAPGYFRPSHTLAPIACTVHRGL